MASGPPLLSPCPLQVSSQAFQGFNCDTIRTAEDGTPLEAYMREDYTVACELRGSVLMAADPTLAATIFATIAIYTCGVPLMYALLFLRARKPLSTGEPTQLSYALSFLTSAYEPRCFWWELVICLEKLVLTSAMIVVLPGTLMQVVAGLVIKLAVLTVTIVAKPFAAESNNLFASAVNSAMVAFFIVILLLKLYLLTTQLLDSASLELRAMLWFDRDAMAVSAIACSISSLVLLLGFLVAPLLSRRKASTVPRATPEESLDQKSSSVPFDELVGMWGLAELAGPHSSRPVCP